MADFSSDTDDSAVEELISQTRDLCVLEQLAAINCSGFSDSRLPADLDSRFSRLKSFPVTNPHSSSSAAPGRRRPEQFRPNAVQPTPTHRNGTVEFQEGKSGPSPAYRDGKGRLKQSISSPLESPNLEDLNEGGTVTGNPGKVEDTEKETNHSFQTPSDSSNSSMDDDDIFCPSELNKEEKSPSKSKLRLKTVCSPLGSSKSWMDSPSPPKRTGCFWCTPKKDSPKRKTKEDRVKGMSSVWSQQDDILSELGILSKKEQKKLMKKAMEEEEKINQEAEKIMRMAKQASARMTIQRMEDELSDDEISK
ncbi:hypothetical protein SAY87_024858 [Trapa incisa]|uniref:Uncharacterized protein n=1 Tax=Trapa incisa TaxID=236973 RepID=A0AAN7GF11_9MYRT|nr:hypothetical protein SAY87_024858 [Trapa incisa]